MADDIDKDEFLETLRSQVGKTGSPMVARDPVNQSTIRNWCDAMAEHNPYYTIPEIAEDGPFGGIVAPPAMLQVWTMTGLVPRSPGTNPAYGGDLQLGEQEEVLPEPRT